jgi:hypothetical protein
MRGDLMDKIQHFLSGVNPNTWYYLEIYALIIAIQFYKVHTDIKNNKAGISRTNYCHLGLEFVYSSIGLVVLLAAHIPDHGGVVFLGFLIVFYVISQFEAKQSEYSPKTSVAVNLIIVAVVMGGSIWANESILSINRPSHDQATTPAVHEYNVAMPYYDFTLRTHVGDKFGPRQLVYLVEVEASSRQDALSAAVKKFWDPNNQDIVPYEPKFPKTQTYLSMRPETAVVEQRDEASGAARAP